MSRCSSGGRGCMFRDIRCTFIRLRGWPYILDHRLHRRGMEVVSGQGGGAEQQSWVAGAVLNCQGGGVVGLPANSGRTRVDAALGGGRVAQVLHEAQPSRLPKEHLEGRPMTGITTSEELGNDERHPVSQGPAAVFLYVPDTADRHERDERRRLA